MLKNIQRIIQDPKFQEKVANLCDKAYAEGTGNPDWYSPFTADDKPEHLGINLAGLTAVNSGLSIIAALRQADPDKSAVAILQEIAENKVNPTEKGILLRLANCSWNAQQPLRTDKGPLGKAGNLNCFDLLPEDEVAKDFHQIQAASKCLLEHLEASASE